MISMQIENAKAVQNALDKFEKRVSQKIVRQATRAAWKPLLDRSKANARSYSTSGGKMWRLIANKLQLRAWPRNKQKKGQYAMYVRIKPKVPEFVAYTKGAHSIIKPSGRPGKTIGRFYIPVALEYGHAFPYRGGSGAKDVAAKPFMRPALDATLPQAPKIFKTHLIRAIREENMKR